jgi:tryptophanyl-tRNA synthetase
MKNEEKTLLSGIQSTGAVHIGNYFGAMKQYVDLQNEYKSYIFIADLHSLTTVQNAKELNSNILNVAMDFLAIGLDPKVTTLFKQSDAPQVAELAWIFESLTTMPYLMRAHAFKDAEAKNKEINVGVFNYPMLMAADILIRDPDVVPVGLDQKQHVEIARDTAEKFNRIYGETFKLPKPLIMENVQTVPGTDGRKMSKSYKNTIELFATDEAIKKAVMSIPTDSKGVDEAKDPEKDNVFAIHKLFTVGTELEELKDRYENGGIGYKESKDMLVKNIIKFTAPLRDKRKEFEDHPDDVIEILHEGGKKARKEAEEKMEEVRRKIGVSFEK